MSVTGNELAIRLGRQRVIFTFMTASGVVACFLGFTAFLPWWIVFVFMALHYGLPAVYQWRDFAVAGGLISYGTDSRDAYRLAGIYIARVLKGEKPADLPVQQATKVELYINLKTATTLGITVPLPLSGRADELME